mgnify:CR=1 FL=1
MLELQKNQTLDLNKETNKTLKTLRLGAGWDVAEGKTIDLDLWLIAKGGKPCFYNNKSIAGAVLDEDDLTGGSSKDGADENISIDVSKLESDEYTVVINIFNAIQKGQFFADVKRAFVEIEDTETRTKVFNYNVSENGGNNFSLVVGKLIKKDGGLTFEAKSEFSTKEAGTLVSENGGLA